MTPPMTPPASAPASTSNGGPSLLAARIRITVVALLLASVIAVLAVRSDRDPGEAAPTDGRAALPAPDIGGAPDTVPSAGSATTGGADGEVDGDDPARVPTVELSHPSGAYAEVFELVLEASTGDDGEPTQILYTLDGSFPDLVANPSRTLVYEGPILVADRSDEPDRLATRLTTIPPDRIMNLEVGPPDLDGPVPKATVIRARAEGGPATSATYFVGPDQPRHDLPVVSLALDEDFLFDHDHGIYVAGRVFEEYAESDHFDPELGGFAPANYHERGRAWERPFADEPWNTVVAEWCELPAPCGHRWDVGVRVHGGITRAFPQKTLRLYARDEYGTSSFDAPLFGDDAPAGHRRLLLRNSGNDAPFTMLRDASLQSLVAHTDLDTQAYRPVVVYINGEYWGIHNLRERYDADYFEVVHGADRANVVIVEHSLLPGVDLTGIEPFEDLLDFIERTDPTSDEFVARIDDEIDVENFFDYVALQVYVGNWDWAINNVRIWREVDGPHAKGEGVRDGRWRWPVFDLDHAGGRAGLDDVEYDIFEDRFAPADSRDVANGYPMMFHRMMQHPDLRIRFLSTYADHLSTSFEAGRAVEQLDSIASVIADEMQRHVERWRRPESVEQWELQVAQLRRYLLARPDVARRQMAERFGVPGTVTVEVATNPDRGRVHVNSVPVEPGTPGVADPSRWSGVYWIDVPVRLEAEAREGYRFAGWEGLPAGSAADPAAPVIEVAFTGDVALTANFAPA